MRHQGLSAGNGVSGHGRGVGLVASVVVEVTLALRLG